jgi:hypothetical protein
MLNTDQKMPLEYNELSKMMRGCIVIKLTLENSKKY